MELIPILTLALVVVLLVLVIVLLVRRPAQPPAHTDSGAISALVALVTQNLREGREAQDSRLAAMDQSVSSQLERFEKRLHGFSLETSQQLSGIRAAVDGGAEEVSAVLLHNGTERPVTLKLPGMTREERDIVLAGCLINYYAK